LGAAPWRPRNRERRAALGREPSWWGPLLSLILSPVASSSHLLSSHRLPSNRVRRTSWRTTLAHRDVVALLPSRVTNVPRPPCHDAIYFDEHCGSERREDEQQEEELREDEQLLDVNWPELLRPPRSRGPTLPMLFRRPPPSDATLLRRPSPMVLQHHCPGSSSAATHAPLRPPVIWITRWNSLFLINTHLHCS
jgi:hypothetical protein